MAAEPADSPKAAYEAYDAAAAAALDMVVQAGNGSNLILDPDLDSYYVMDALITKLPAIADNAGRVVDLEAVVAADDSIDNQIALAGAQVRCGRPRPRTGAGLSTAFEKTADPALEPALAPRRRRRPGRDDLAATRSHRRARDKRSAPRLDALLVARMDHFSAARIRSRADRRRSARSWPRSCSPASSSPPAAACARSPSGWRDLRDDSRELSAALDAMAGGDLTVEIAPDSRPIEYASSDELGQIVEAANGILESTAESIAGYNRMRSSLDRDRHGLRERRHGVGRVAADGGELAGRPGGR